MKIKTTRSRLNPKKLSMAITLALIPAIVSGQLFNAVEPLEDLNGSNGFMIIGAGDGDGAGRSVSAAGDFNGDGIDDVIIGAFQGLGFGADNDGSGRSYVVFGKDNSIGFSASINLSELDGSNGFELAGISPLDKSGSSVSGIGDINGDGIDDIAIGAPDVKAPAFPIPDLQVGQVYVVFGSTSGLPASMSLSELDGNNGFTINGNEPNHLVGRKVNAAGDFNGDGIDDLLIGAPGFDNGSPGLLSLGSAYIVFGSTAGFASSMSLSEIDGTNGVRFTGTEIDDAVGFEIGALGDFNGDGIDDVIIGAHGSTDEPPPGTSYVVFGSTNTFPASVTLANLNGSDGFAINGITPEAAAPNQGSADGIGDINGDGFNDLIIGNRLLALGAGISYVVFGGSGSFPASMELSDLNGSNGFVINGDTQGGGFRLFGNDAGTAGDINGDGIDDLIVAAYVLDAGRGTSYIIFGNTSGFPSTMDITNLNGSNGFSLPGVRESDRAGTSVSAAGDFNNDGIDDFIIGSAANPSDFENAVGASYIVFGRQDNIFSNGFE